MEEGKEDFNLWKTLEAHIPKEELSEVHRILLGQPSISLEVSRTAAGMAEDGDFDILGYQFPAPTEQIRPPRIVRIGLVQNSIVLDTTAPVVEQYEAIERKMARIIEAASEMEVNILCTQEAWICPFFFCTREKEPWLQFAESAEYGRSTRFMQRMARRHNMVIVSCLLERDEAHGDVLWNTAGMRGLICAFSFLMILHCFPL